MFRRLLAALAVALPLVASGCSDNSSSTPTSPREGFSAAAGAALSCSFSNISGLIKDEFLDNGQKQAASTDLQAMKQAGQRTSGAKAAGFHMMGVIASAKHMGTAGGASIGSNLTNQLILCMFTPNTDFVSDSFPFDFVVSLDPTQPGGYEIKGPTGDATPALSFPTTESQRLSSIAPADGKLWSDVLSETVLLYGRPVLLGGVIRHDAYEWSTFRPGATFNYPPGVEVGLCDLPNDPQSNNLVTESNVGLLGLVVTPANCDPNGVPFPTASLNRGWQPFDLVRGIGRWGAGLITPEPLHAATLLLTKTIGGVGGGKSIFTLGSVTSPITFTFVTQPTDTRVGVAIKPPVQVKALYQGQGVGGVTITVGGVNNNGTPTEVLCPNSPCTAKTAPGGIATIDNLTSTKSGALILVISDATMPGTTGITFTTGQASNKINVRPAIH